MSFSCDIYIFAFFFSHHFEIWVKPMLGVLIGGEVVRKLLIFGCLEVCMYMCVPYIHKLESTRKILQTLLLKKSEETVIVENPR